MACRLTCNRICHQLIALIGRNVGKSRFQLVLQLIITLAYSNGNCRIGVKSLTFRETDNRKIRIRCNNTVGYRKLRNNAVNDAGFQSLNRCREGFCRRLMNNVVDLIDDFIMAPAKSWILVALT